MLASLHTRCLHDKSDGQQLIMHVPHGQTFSAVAVVVAALPFLMRGARNVCAGPVLRAALAMRPFMAVASSSETLLASWPPLSSSSAGTESLNPGGGGAAFLCSQRQQRENHSMNLHSLTQGLRYS